MKSVPALATTLALFVTVSATAATPMIRAADMKPGVTVHVDAYGSVSREIGALRALSVHRVRVDAPQPGYLGPGNSYDALCSAGFKMTPFLNGWINASDDLSSHAEFAATKSLEKRHHGCIENIEGPNEINNFPEHFAGLTGSSGAQAFQTALYARVKSDGVLRRKPVIGYTDVHPVDSPSDLANAHPYVGSWWQDLVIHQTAPQMPKGKPWAATEYGWSTPPKTSDRTVTEAVQAQRVVAGVAAMAANGFNPAFLYELRDEGVSVSDGEQHFGLFRSDWTPKPAAIALTHLLAETTDRGADAETFRPTPFAVTITDPHVKSLLLAKSDGSYVLLYWMNKHLGDAPSTFDIALASPRMVTGVRVESGELTAYGRKALLSGLTFSDTDALGILRISAT